MEYLRSLKASGRLHFGHRIGHRQTHRRQATGAIRQVGGASCDSVIVATAHAMAEELARFRATGLRDTLIKPITSQTLQMQTDPAPILIELGLLRTMVKDVGPDRVAGLADRFLTNTGQAVGQLVSPGRDVDQAMIREIHRPEGSIAMFGAQAMRLVLPLDADGLGRRSRGSAWP